MAAMLACRRIESAAIGVDVGEADASKSLSSAELHAAMACCCSARAELKLLIGVDAGHADAVEAAVEDRRSACRDAVAEMTRVQPARRRDRKAAAMASTWSRSMSSKLLASMPYCTWSLIRLNAGSAFAAQRRAVVEVEVAAIGVDAVEADVVEVAGFDADRTAAAEALGRAEIEALPSRRCRRADAVEVAAADGRGCKVLLGFDGEDSPSTGIDRGAQPFPGKIDEKSRARRLSMEAKCAPALRSIVRLIGKLLHAFRTRSMLGLRGTRLIDSSTASVIFFRSMKYGGQVDRVEEQSGCSRPRYACLRPGTPRSRHLSKAAADPGRTANADRRRWFDCIAGLAAQLGPRVGGLRKTIGVRDQPSVGMGVMQLLPSNSPVERTSRLSPGVLARQGRA